MTADETALLRAIRAAEDDDLPRLVYADWLDERERSDHDIVTAQFIRLSCDGRPPRRADGSLFPMRQAAVDWLDAGNWRRLLPRLCQDWDKAVELWAKLSAERTSTGEAILGGRTLVWGEIETLPPPPCYLYLGDVRGEYRVGVPFFLPNSDGNVRAYTPLVRVRFQRGFAAACTWRAPHLGKHIAGRLAHDQPLATTAGPGRIRDVFEYLKTR